ncbi:hypothetical protein F5876DRAFT_79399 [Lentinula aff. lateritia]|uniref:Uncharacterized protein n=1 Tax=Lentinula aff. lateritia TaxID=2804960 RepID=A0ACC1TT68_9AGAR|nr:hypothetical protein F5876DRAFT_79399 [Lentinula aff. lateritia]
MPDLSSVLLFLGINTVSSRNTTTTGTSVPESSRTSSLNVVEQPDLSSSLGEAFFEHRNHSYNGAQPALSAESSASALGWISRRVELYGFSLIEGPASQIAL